MNAIDLSKYENALNLAKEALKFYADEKTYSRTQMTTPIDLDHHGHQARYAIETIDLILEPDYGQEKLDDYKKSLMEHQQIEIEEAIKNMGTQLSMYKQQYDALLDSGMFFEKFPDLSGVWSADKEKFINKMITDKNYGI